MKAALTDKTIASLRLPVRGQVEVWDTVVTDLYLRVGQGGSKTWYRRVYQSGVLGRERLGPWPAVRTSEARNLVRLGVKVESPTLNAASAATFASVCTAFLVEAGLAESTRAEWSRLVRAEMTPIAGINPGDAKLLRARLQSMLAAIAQRSTYTRNRTFEAARRIYNWGVGRDLIEPAPVFAGIEKLPEVPRERVLSDDELRRILAAVDLDYPHWRVYWRLLTLTALRRGSIIAARLEHVDWERGALLVPSVNMKGRVDIRKAMTVPLVAGALEALRARRDARLKSTWIVTNYLTGEQIENPQKTKERVAEIAGVSDWHVHDIRTTISTNLGRLGVSSETIDRVLGHAHGTRISRVYNQWEYFDEKKAALECWAAHLESLRTI